MHYIDLSKWYWRILAVVIVAAVIYLVFMVVGGVLTLDRSAHRTAVSYLADCNNFPEF